MPPRRSVSIDTEFLSYGGEQIPLQVGYSRPVARRRQHSVGMGQGQVEKLLTSVYHDAQSAGRRGVNELYDMAAGLKNVPTASIMADAIDQARNATDVGQVGSIARAAHASISSRDDLLTPQVAERARKQFGGATVVGSNIRQADMPILRGLLGEQFVDDMNVVDLMDYSDNHPAVQMMRSLNPKAAPGRSGDFMADLQRGFRSEIEPMVNTVLEAAKVDSAGVKWGSHVGMSTGTASLSDAYLITGGQMRHAAGMAAQGYEGLGVLSPGANAHGAGFDAALGASIGDAMQNMTEAEIAYGTQLVVANRVHGASQQTSSPMSEAEALDAVMKQGKAIGGTSTSRPGEEQARKAAAAAGATAGGAFGFGSASKAVNKGAQGLADRMAKSGVAKAAMSGMGSRLGRAVVVGAGLSVAAAAAANLNMMFPSKATTSSHIGSDRLAMAMAMGG
jgi:hypothetical protein